MVSSWALSGGHWHLYVTYDFPLLEFFFLSFQTPFITSWVSSNFFWWFPVISTSRYSCPFVIPSSWVWVGPNDFLLLKRTHQNNRMSPLRLCYKKTLASILLMLSWSLICSLWWSQLSYCELLCGKANRKWACQGETQRKGSRTGNSQWGTESCQQPLELPWNLILPQLSLERISILADTLIAALGETLKRRI